MVITFDDSHNEFSTEFKRELIVFNRSLSVPIMLSLLFKAIFGWLRLNDALAFYVTLIRKTFKDMLEFFFILLLAIIFFGFTFYMLQLNALPGQENTIIEIRSGNDRYPTVDSFLN